MFRPRLVLAGMLLAVAGCGDNGGRVPVVGTVTLDGNPVEGATVAFFPEPGSPGQGGFGKTDANGRYEIAYDFTGKGLIPGNYRATISKSAVPPNAEGTGSIDVPIRGGGGVPSLYANPDATPLRATVEPGGRPIDFKLETPRKTKAK